MNKGICLVSHEKFYYLWIVCNSIINQHGALLMCFRLVRPIYFNSITLYHKRLCAMAVSDNNSWFLVIGRGNM